MKILDGEVLCAFYMIKFVYSKKATKFCEISNVNLTVTTQDKSSVEISQKFVAFSAHLSFIYQERTEKYVATNLLKSFSQRNFLKSSNLPRW